MTTQGIWFMSMTKCSAFSKRAVTRAQLQLLLCVGFPCSGEHVLFKKRSSWKLALYRSDTAAAKSLQSCPTLCDPIDRSPTRLPRPWDSPGKNTGVGCHFLLQCMKVKSLSHDQLLATAWTAAYQATPSMGFSRPEYWSGVPMPSPLASYKQGSVSLC